MWVMQVLSYIIIIHHIVTLPCQQYHHHHHHHHHLTNLHCNNVLCDSSRLVCMNTSGRNISNNIFSVLSFQSRSRIVMCPPPPPLQNENYFRLLSTEVAASLPPGIWQAATISEIYFQRQNSSAYFTGKIVGEWMPPIFYKILPLLWYCIYKTMGCHSLTGAAVSDDHEKCQKVIILFEFSQCGEWRAGLTWYILTTDTAEQSLNDESYTIFLQIHTVPQQQHFKNTVGGSAPPLPLFPAPKAFTIYNLMHWEWKGR